ncbi:MAG: hypothetical protein ACI88C_000249 [Acidimicrobiales bacterium]
MPYPQRETARFNAHEVFLCQRSVEDIATMLNDIKTTLSADSSTVTNDD